MVNYTTSYVYITKVKEILVYVRQLDMLHHKHHKKRYQEEINSFKKLLSTGKWKWKQMIFTQTFFSTKSTNLKNNWNLDLNEHRKVKQIIKSQNLKTLRLNPRTYKGGGWLVVGDSV